MEGFDVPTRRKHSAYASALARHVSADGCQFVVERSPIEQGQRLSFALEGYPPVLGTVRWVVKDRVGFAFDRPISRDAQSAMVRRSRVVQGLDLYLS
ncbi:PilZ domain-containing protein [Novosphingobium resinovorum]|uniref:PilZ domain-containing protein n=1 Tax=Novosphingobium resinovorum TaxID=158500 RepID=UPI002ED27FE7|nr:PilZ domain-containing protein [Novosphingobium resinovorum]